MRSVDARGPNVGAFYARFPDKEAFLDHFDGQGRKAATSTTLERFLAGEWPEGAERV